MREQQTARGRLETLAPWIGLGVSLALIPLAIIVPPLLGQDVNVRWFPPLHAEWMPRLGPGTLPAVLLAIAASVWGGPLARRLPWGGLLATAYAAGVAWMVALATVDGWEGIGSILEHRYEYLGTAREVTDFGATLREYVSRIPLDSEDNWPVHIAGHPPGALLFFVVLVRLGLGGGLAAGFVVLLVGASAAVAVLLLLRRLGAEDAARRAAPFLAMGPAAIWFAVSADGMFAAVAAWGLCTLGFAATARRPGTMAAWSVLAGLLLGYCVMMSYGLPLLGILALAVLALGRDWRPLPIAAVAALAVVLAFAAFGFAWWEAFPVLVERYWDGVASRRQFTYWVWGNLAALSFSAGPLAGAAVATAGARGLSWRAQARPERVVIVLALAAALTIVAADLSQMSKAEVERIWLPFVPWLLVGTALLTARWRRWGFAGQLAFALVVQHLLLTSW
ncbi:hypothetical protein [Agromyces marinus]|uniref:Membrane protein n=1 Tax=Agromyces marinus TaxID=1389020 RepID=A0ABM8H168_9MICO|nr:hypothetical protein [Agromyces marinus]UIP57363.1 hypothetical protein DSM26151_02180 [Agromyces marinus]BDZ54529.1 membrane protein [Agromyces marinus]